VLIEESDYVSYLLFVAGGLRGAWQWLRRQALHSRPQQKGISQCAATAEGQRTDRSS
jgi:hypothetical protein